MTLTDLLELLGRHPKALLAFFGAVPAVTWIVGRFHDRPRGGGLSPWRYVYSVLAYLTSVPGVVATVLLAYTFFFTDESLLDLNMMVFFLPPLSMVLTLVLMSKNVGFNEVPGFDRLSGLIVMLAVSFVVALVLQKIFIVIFFGASIVYLLIFAVAAFLLLSWASGKVFGTGS